LEKEYDYGKETAWKFGLIHYRVGYGLWAIGGSGWQFALGKQSDDDSLAAIDRALELGLNWIDTAAAYGLGHSEEIVARALATWSNAAHADVTMAAKPRSELRKNSGIVQRIRSLFRSNNLGHAEVAGMKDGEPDKFTTEQLGKKAYRNVQLDPNGQVNPNDAYTQMKRIIEQDEAE